MRASTVRWVTPLKSTAWPPVRRAGRLLDDGDVAAVAVEPVGECGAGDARAGDEDLRVLHGQDCRRGPLTAHPRSADTQARAWSEHCQRLLAAHRARPRERGREPLRRRLPPGGLGGASDVAVPGHGHPAQRHGHPQQKRPPPPRHSRSRRAPVGPRRRRDPGTAVRVPAPAPPEPPRPGLSAASARSDRQRRPTRGGDRPLVKHPRPAARPAGPAVGLAGGQSGEGRQDVGLGLLGAETTALGGGQRRLQPHDGPRPNPLRPTRALPAPARPWQEPASGPPARRPPRRAGSRRSRPRARPPVPAPQPGAPARPPLSSSAPSSSSSSSASPHSTRQRVPLPTPARDHAPASRAPAPIPHRSPRARNRASTSSSSTLGLGRLAVEQRAARPGSTAPEPRSTDRSRASASRSGPTGKAGRPDGHAPQRGGERVPQRPFQPAMIASARAQCSGAALGTACSTHMTYSSSSPGRGRAGRPRAARRPRPRPGCAARSATSTSPAPRPSAAPSPGRAARPSAARP